MNKIKNSENIFPSFPCLPGKKLRKKHFSEGGKNNLVQNTHPCTVKRKMSIPPFSL